MDVRLLAFLARQPSAALKNREHFLGLPKRGLAFLLVNAMFWQPLWAQADGIVVSAPGTTLGQAGNGVPIVNIAAPNGSGLSHNQFKDYNVGANGVILNNATDRTQSTQLGGIILGNSNLNGRAASTILNEVNGGSPSQLRGYTEVAGQSAHVIVANPYGISCNGCGFINTPQATLTTGKPIVENGQVTRYQVDQGSVSLEGAGLNANNIDRFEIITRSARLNAEIQAKNLAIIAGANDVDAKTLKATARAANPANAPQLAIDSSALGGMYAGAIKLVGTEAGVGVKLDGKMVASGGDIQLDANGHLSMAQTTAAGAVTVKAESLDAQGAVYAGTHVEATTRGSITNQRSIAARDSVVLTADGQLNNLGIIAAGVNADNSRNQDGDVSLTAGSIDNRGQSVIASRDLTATATKTLDNRSGTLTAKNTLTLTAQDLDNRAGVVASEGELKAVVATTLDNRERGTITSDAKQALAVASLKNTDGTISSKNSLKLEVAALDNQSGKIASDGALTLEGGNVENGKGQITSQSDIVVTANTFKQQGGKLVGQGKLTLTADSIDNSRDGYIASAHAMSLTAYQRLLNTEKGLISTQEGLAINGGGVDNSTGSLISQTGLSVTLNDDLINQDGSVITQGGNLEVESRHLDNRGGVLASVGGWLKTTLSTVLDNGTSLSGSGEAGLIQAQSINLGAEQQVLNNGGQVSALSSDVVITTTTLENRNGSLLAKQGLTVHAQGLDNSIGRVAADSIDFGLTGALNNRAGLVEGSNGLLIRAASIDNQGGKLRSLGKLGSATLTIDQLLDNQRGTIEAANHDISLSMTSFRNADGNVRHVGAGTFGVELAKFSNVGGSLMTSGTLTVDAANWDNSSDIQADVLNLNVTRLNQTAGGKLVAARNLVAKGGTWNNAGSISSDGALELKLDGAYVGSSSSRVGSVGEFDLSAASIDVSSDSRLTGGGATTVTSLGALTNAGRITGTGRLSLTAASLNNTGTLGGAAIVELTADDARNERGLIFSGADMVLRFKSLTNYYADIYSLGGLSLSARDGIARSAVLENISGTIESTTDISLRSDVLINRKDIFSTTDELVSGSISVTCHDCSGDHHNVDYVAQESYKSVVLADSAAGSIQSGAKLKIEGSTIANQYSVMASGSDLLIVADSFTNKGASSGSSVRTRTWNTGRVTDGTDNRFRANYIYPYNAQPNPKVLPVGALNSFNLIGDITTVTPGAPMAAAVVQAGGNISIQATQQLENSSIVQFVPPAPVAGKTTETGVVAGARPAVVVLNPQLPPELAQQQVNPTTMPGFTLPSGQNGLFRVVDSAGAAQGSHDQSQARVQGSDASRVIVGPKYLIETNPVLTDLKQFMSSDYLLGNLGYDPDTSWKRLGDGLYEQRLIQQAVVARTGQRFLGGQTTDEGMFKYLMNNAIASKDQLNLSVGVTLTPQQVAALTHDIVWMEDQVVNGKHVLVPVLYLAQANNRLMADGALIQGKDVTLISGADLKNSGTLRASENLAAASGGDLVNSRLAEAGQKMKLLAGNDLINTQGGIIKGGDVELSTLVGDILNERTVSVVETTGKGFSTKISVVDNAARIEAGNDLKIHAVGNLLNIGGAVSAGKNAELSAGKDVLIASAREESGSMRQDKRHFWEQSQTVQHASEIKVGGDLAVTATDDLTIVASHLDAKGDVDLLGKDVTLMSAANEEASEYRYKRSGKKVNNEEEHVRQQATTLKAGGDVHISASHDLAMISSRITAGNEAYLVAGNQLSLLAEQDRDYSLHDMKKKGSWGSKATKRDEVTKVTHVGSEITTGGDLILKSGDDQRYQVAKLNSGRDLILDSGGAITFEGVKDLEQESHEKSKSSLAWNSMKGKGLTDETLRQTQMLASGEIIIKAVDGLKIDVKQVNQQSVSQTIDAMVKADPQMAWLKDAEKRGDVDWRQVKEIHDSFKYSNSSLGQGAMLAIIIIVTVLTAGAASAAVGTAAGAGAGSGSVMAAATTSQALAAGASYTAAGWGNAMATAALTSAASTGAVSVINNKGNLGATLKDVTSSSSLKNYVTGALTAGFSKGVLDPSFGITGKDVVSPTHGFNLSTLEGIGGFTGYSLIEGLAQGGIKTVIKGGSFKDNIGSGMVGQAGNAAMAVGFNWVGDTINYADGSPQKILAHAVMGGLMAELTGSNFKTGAVVGAVNEALIKDLSGLLGVDKSSEKVVSQLLGILAAASVNGDVGVGAQIAGNATTFNRQLHVTERELAQKLAAKSGGKYTVEQIENQLRLSSVTGTKIIASTDMVAKVNEIYDTGGNWMPLGDGQYVQNFARADKDIIAFIKSNIGIYSWTPEAETGFSSYPKSESGSYREAAWGRDRLTGYALDEKGGYRVPIAIDGAAYVPRYFPCGNTDCLVNGANIDFSDVATLRWIQASNAKAISDFGWIMGAGAVPATGASLALLANGSTAAALLSGFLKGDLVSSVESSAISIGFERFATSRGVSPELASKISTALGTAGVWDAIVEKSNGFFKGE
ncbi:two-partner secretion domain-containing protein [Pseudomonas gingeri]